MCYIYFADFLPAALQSINNRKNTKTEHKSESSTWWCWSHGAVTVETIQTELHLFLHCIVLIEVKCNLSTD